MVARRPFASRAAVIEAAGEIWTSLAPTDWLEAFSHHPRIGEKTGAVAQSGQGSAWSAREQAGVDRAESGVRGELARVNHEYEQRFGYIYIVCASGKTADELLAIARARLANDPHAELAVAAEEQRMITRLRLEKILEDRS